MKKIWILLKAVITLVLIAPPALLAIENISMRPIKHPRPVLLRTWDVQVNTHDGRMRFVFRIHEDGAVDGTVETMDGTVGKVAMQNAFLKRNRHWFSKLLGQRRDYKVEGRLEGSPVEKPKESFWIEFNCDRNGSMTKIKAGL